MEGHSIALFFALGFVSAFGGGYALDVGSRTVSGELHPDVAQLIAEIIALKATDLVDVVQSGRRLLQRARQWQSSHPAEWQFGKCLIRYCIDVKVPGVVPYSDNDYDDIDYDALLIEPAERSPKFVEMQPRTIEDFDDVKQTHMELKVKLVKTLHAAYTRAMEYLTRHQLLGCTAHYVLSKFWMWIDSAP